MFDMWDFVCIVSGIVLAQLIVQQQLYTFPVYIWQRLITYMKRRRELRDKAAFYDNPANNHRRNVLFLCHGREHGFPNIRNPSSEIFPNLEDFNFWSVDSDPTKNPHVVADVADPNLFDVHLKSIVFDCIVLFDCPCCTYAIYGDEVELTSRIWKHLSNDGIFLVKSCGSKDITRYFTQADTARWSVHFIKLPSFASFGGVQLHGFDVNVPLVQYLKRTEPFPARLSSPKPNRMVTKLRKMTAKLKSCHNGSHLPCVQACSIGSDFNDVIK